MATATAQDDHGLESARPIELCAFDYHLGKGPADLDAVVADWNAWADDREISDFSAWTLVPYYFDRKKDADFIWLGVSPTGKSLGRTQDKWIATGGPIAEKFNKVSTCRAHLNFSSLLLRSPPDLNSAGAVVAVSDCNLADDVVFSDVIPSFQSWTEYLDNHGSTAGLWVLLPAYGGGSDGFDFKLVATHRNLEEQGVDYDEYRGSGVTKAQDLFGGMLSCGSPIVYLAQQRRQVDIGATR